MRTLFIICIIFFFCPGVTSFHPVHVSVANIEYVDKNKKIDISFKIYIDDFEYIISHKYGIQFGIDSIQGSGNNINYINKYISESFELIINENIKADINFKEEKTNEEAIWLYYKYSVPEKVNKISITNSILMDLFMDQVMIELQMLVNQLILLQ